MQCNAACGGSVRRIFSNTNDKTLPSTLNNLLYSHQQFLPEQTATSHASSSLHVLHQASSFIKKLIIMTQPRMIEQRREFMRHPDIYLKISYHSYFSITLPNIAEAYHSVQRNERGHPLPRAQPRSAFSGQTKHPAYHRLLRPQLQQTRRIRFRT